MCTCCSLKQERRGVTTNALQLGFFDKPANGKLQQTQCHYYYTVAFFSSCKISFYMVFDVSVSLMRLIANIIPVAANMQYFINSLTCNVWRILF